jgi:hypothetical protein
MEKDCEEAPTQGKVFQYLLGPLIDVVIFDG